MTAVRGTNTIAFAQSAATPTSLPTQAIQLDIPTPTPKPIVASNVNTVLDVSDTISFDIEHVFGGVTWYQDKLDDGTIVLDQVEATVQNYVSTEKASLRYGVNQFFLITKVKSTESDIAIIKSTLQKYFGDAAKFAFTEPEISPTYRGVQLTSISSFVSGSSTIQVIDFNEGYEVNASGIRLQDGSYGVVIGIQAGGYAFQLAASLSSTDIPILSRDLLIEQSRSRAPIPIKESTTTFADFGKVTLGEPYSTQYLPGLNFSFIPPASWIVVHDANLTGEVAYIGTSQEAIEALQRNLPIPQDELAGTITISSRSASSRQNQRPIGETLDSWLRLLLSLRQESSVDAIYVETTDEQQPVAYAVISNRVNQSYIAAIDSTYTHGIVELFANPTELDESSLAIAATVARTVEPINLTYKDQFTLESSGSFRHTFFLGFEEYVYRYPGNWRVRENVPHFGTVLELPAPQGSDQQDSPLTVSMVGVPFFSPTQWISIFDWGGLGLQEFSPPQGFLLGGRRVVASKGIGTLGSEILMIVLEVRVDSAGNSEYVSILARTNDTTLITDYEALVLAITETIRNASEPEPTPTPMPNGQADVNADSLPSAGSSISLSVNGYLRSDDLCVEVGDTVRLVAQGTIKLGFWLGSSDPNGIEQGMLGAIGDSYDIVPHHPHGALLCKISGESEWRICGSYLEFTSERAGCLEFEINDTDQRDNTGQFNITASLLPPVSLTPTPQPVATSDQSDASSTLLSAEEFLAETEEGDIEAVLAQADLYYWANEDAEALTLYQYALELDPDSVVALTGRGNIYRINKDYEQALRDFEDALAIDPTYPPIYRGLGKLSSDQGDLQQALLEFNKAIELDANYTKAYIARGDLYSNLSDYTSALADYNKAISLDPSDEALYLTRGYTHYYLNNFDAALADFSTTIRLKPDSPAPYAGRGDAYLAKDNNDAALTEYTQAIELDSTYAYAFDRRGLAYAAKGNWNQAIADYTQAIELGLEYSELYRRRGDAFRELNEGAKAFADFDHAIQQDPENMNARYNRAWLHDESGHTEEAYDDYSRYLELDTGDNDFAKYACLRVNQLYPSIAKSFLDAALSRPCQRFLSSSNLPTCYVKETYYDSDDVTYACYDSNNLWAFDKTCNGTGPWSSCDCPVEFKEWGAC